MGSRGEERRREILEAAERIFGRSGYAAATTADVAREVGITQPALYRYFASKRELFLGALTLRQRAINQAYAEAIAKHTSAIEKIRAIGHATIELAHRFPAMSLLRIQAVAVAAADEELRPQVLGAMRALMGVHEQLLREAAEADEIARTIDPRFTSSVIAGQAFILYVGLALGHEDAHAEIAHRNNDHFVDALLHPHETDPG